MVYHTDLLIGILCAIAGFLILAILAYCCWSKSRKAVEAPDDALTENERLLNEGTASTPLRSPRTGTVSIVGSGTGGVGLGASSGLPPGLKLTGNYGELSRNQVISIIKWIDDCRAQCCGVFPDIVDLVSLASDSTQHMSDDETRFPSGTAQSDSEEPARFSRRKP
jgi:hypothetical protein